MAELRRDALTGRWVIVSEERAARPDEYAVSRARLPASAVDCPFCEGLMEVDIETGEVVNKWSASERLKSGDDKMKAALQKMQDAKKKRADLFEQTKEGLHGQNKRVEDELKKQVERLKKEGIDEKPITPFDLD